MKAILSLIAIVLCLSCNSEPNIEFPIEVGTKPESITKGFNDNYYVTVMNNKETGDGTVVEISAKGVRTFATGSNSTKWFNIVSAFVIGDKALVCSRKLLHNLISPKFLLKINLCNFSKDTSIKGVNSIISFSKPSL